MSVVKNQYLYKLKKQQGLFTGLAIIQILILVLTMGRTGGMGTGTGNMQLDVSRFSSLPVIVGTISWAFVVSLILSKRALFDEDFAFVSNRISSNLANICFMLTAAVIGGITILLNSSLIKVIMYYYLGAQNIIETGFFYSPGEIWIGLISTFFYILLFSGIGYFMGILTELNNLYLALLPAFLIGSLIYVGNTVSDTSDTNVLIKTLNFFFQESSLAIFVVKVVITSLILFFFSILISNRMEVRK